MIQDPIIAASENNKRHPSILKIKNQIRICNYFNFKHIDDKKFTFKKCKCKKDYTRKPY